MSAISEPFTAMGWVAAADHDGTPWLEPGTVRCPPDPSLEDLAEMRGPQRVHCYGSRALTFTGTIHGGVFCGDPTFLRRPELLASCRSVFTWGDSSSDVLVALPPEFQEAIGPRGVDDSFKATITAHMDDPAARTCEGGFYVPSAYDADIFVLGCRAMFVATSFALLAT